MACAGDQRHRAEVVGDAGHLGAEGWLLGAADDDVVDAGEEGDGNLDLRAVELGRRFPVAVHVAVVVHAAAEARLFEFVGDVVEVFLLQPGGKRARLAEARDPSAGGAFWVGDRRRIARRVVGGIKAREKAAWIAVIFGFGGAGLLMVEYVVEILAACIGRLHADSGRSGAASAIGHAHRDHRRDAVRMQQRGVPGDDRAPVMADDDGLLGAIGVDEPDNVASGVMDVVVGDGGRLVRLPIAAHIGRDDLVACSGDGGDLMAPGIPALWPAMNEHHQRRILVVHWAHLGDA